jgi:hypothetical protein
MRRPTDSRFTGGVRLAVGATAFAGLVATLAGSAIAAMPDTRSESKSSTAGAVTAAYTEGVVNEWAAGDAAVARYLAQEDAVQQQLVPDLVDPIVRRRLACSFAPGSFGIAPQRTPAVGDGTCRAAG